MKVFIFNLTGEHRMQFWKCGYLTWPCCCRIWPGSSGCGKSVYILIHTPSCYVYLVGTERYWWMHGISLLAICPPKNALCPSISKNSFDRLIWQVPAGAHQFDGLLVPAAKLFQGLSGMCWCYFQTRGSTLDLRSEQKGLLWILDEESIFPGANDSSFLARLYVHHCNDSEYKIMHHSSNAYGLWEMSD